MAHRLTKIIQMTVGVLFMLSLAQCQSMRQVEISRVTPVVSSGAAQAVLNVNAPAVATQTMSSRSTAQSPAKGLPSPQPTTTQQPVVVSTQAVLSAGEPAGCLSAEQQTRLSSVDLMLRRAGTLISLPRSLSARQQDSTWNAFTQEHILKGSVGDQDQVTSLNVADIRDYSLLQKILNALQVSGFITWLRVEPNQGINILLIPLLDPAILHSSWAPYIQAYWQSRDALPTQDEHVVAALKLPPCHWMIEGGFAPQVDVAWWSAARSQRPDYATAAQPYIALTTAGAFKSAQRIDWLGLAGIEGPQAMCGPLVWAILRDSSAFPPDLANWSTGPKSFWFSNPRTDGRPWSLFAPGTYQVTSFKDPMGTFDFKEFPLYPGDFIYSYSKSDGFDHMFLVTEIDAAGNLYTVTNLIREHPVEKMTVEKVILYNIHDPTVGIIRNEWYSDRLNGRTGDDGFDVFRWDWVEKDIRQQPAAVQVMPGDTWGLLAERWKTPAAEIAKFNGKSVNDILTIGATLQIPPVQDARLAGD